MQDLAHEVATLTQEMQNFQREKIDRCKLKQKQV